VKGERGQALVELLAALPIVLTVGAVIFQLLAAGYSAVLAGSAAEAGALAVANGASARVAVQHALPGWSERRVHVEVADGTVRVSVRPPALLAAVARELEIEREAVVELP
jgi:hypothetical protein